MSYSYEKNARFTEDTACWWMPLSALQKRTCDQHRSFRYLLVTHLLDNATDCQRLWGKFRARAPHDNNEFYLCVSGRVLHYLWYPLCGTTIVMDAFLMLPDFEWISTILHICHDFLQGILMSLILDLYVLRSLHCILITPTFCGTVLDFLRRSRFWYCDTIDRDLI